MKFFECTIRIIPEIYLINLCAFIHIIILSIVFLIFVKLYLLHIYLSFSYRMPMIKKMYQNKPQSVIFHREIFMIK